MNECFFSKIKVIRMLAQKYYLYTLRKYMKHGFFTQLQRTFYAKKGSIMTRRIPFVTKVLYRLLFIYLLHYSATFCSCN